MGVRVGPGEEDGGKGWVGVRGRGVGGLAGVAGEVWGGPGGEGVGGRYRGKRGEHWGV